MSNPRNLTRYLAAAGAVGVAVLALAAPVPALADQASGPGVDIGRALDELPDQGPGVDIGRSLDELPPITREQRGALLDQIDRPLPSYPEHVVRRPVTRTVTVDDGSLEVVQIALGAVAGAALVAGGTAAVSARHRRHIAHPA